MFGARVYVTDFAQVNAQGEREEYIPTAEFYGVEFKNTGQEGFRDTADPRYSLAIRNSNPAAPSFVKSCSINKGFNHGIGVIGSPMVEVLDNVIYQPLGSGVLTVSEKVTLI